MRKLIFVLAALSLMGCCGCPSIAQTDPVTTKSLTLQIGNPPQPVNSANVSSIGNTGPRNLYYWVVSRNAAGASSPAGPFALMNGPGALSSSVKVSIAWASATNATSYDVLRTNTPAVPTGACNCAVATAVTATTTSDQSETLQSYTVAAFDQSSAAVTLTNKNGVVTATTADGQPAAVSVGNITINGTCTGSGCNNGGGSGGGWNPLGAWDNSATYGIGDVVYYATGLWVSLAANSNVAPGTNQGVWALADYRQPLITQSGILKGTGSGVTNAVPGTDYATPAQVAAKAGVSGTTVAGHCAEFADNNGTVTDAGQACGTGRGGGGPAATVFAPTWTSGLNYSSGTYVVYYSEAFWYRIFDGESDGDTAVPGVSNLWKRFSFPSLSAVAMEGTKGVTGTLCGSNGDAGHLSACTPDDIDATLTYTPMKGAGYHPSLGADYVSAAGTVPNGVSVVANHAVGDYTGSIQPAGMYGPALGIAVTSVSGGGPVEVAVMGNVSCLFTGTAVAGHLVGQNSDSTCADLAQTQVSAISQSVQILGRAKTAGTGVQTVELFGPGGIYGTKALNPANNLSDVANAAAARINLGLGSAAEHPASDFATVGTLANTTGQKLRQLMRAASTSNSFTNPPLNTTPAWVAATLYPTGSVVAAGGQSYVQHNGASPAPTLATVGTAGSTTYKYAVVATNGTVSGTTGLGSPYLNASATVSITSGPATLNGSNYIAITTTATNSSALTQCSVYRMNTTTGYVGTTTCGSVVNDQGTLLSATGPPAYSSFGWPACYSGASAPTGTSAYYVADGTCQWYWNGMAVNSASPYAPTITFSSSVTSGMTSSFLSGITTTDTSLPGTCTSGQYYATSSGSTCYCYPANTYTCPSKYFQFLGGMPSYRGVGGAVCLASNTHNVNGNGTGGACTAARDGSIQHYVWQSDAPRLQLRFYGGTGPMALVVDGQLVDAGDEFIPSGYPEYGLVDFTNAGGRKIRTYMLITAFGESPGFVGVDTDPAYRVWAPSTANNVRVAVVGDSLTGGGSGFPDRQAGGFWMEVATALLGWNDVISLAIGGTGFQSTSSGVAPNYQTRIADVCNANADGSLGVLIVFDAINDPNASTWGPNGGDGSCSLTAGTGNSCTCSNGTCSGTGCSCTGEAAYVLSFLQGVRSCHAAYGTPDFTGPIILVGNWPSNTGPSAARQMLDIDEFNAYAVFADSGTLFIPMSAQGCSGTSVPCTAAGSSGWPTGAWNAVIPATASGPMFTGTGTVAAPVGTPACSTFPVSGSCAGSTDIYLDAGAVHPTNDGIKAIGEKLADAIKAAINQMP